MTTKQATDAFLAGGIVAVVEYRSHKVEPRKWKDPATNRLIEWVNVIHNVEAGNEQLKVTERLPDGVEAGAYKGTFKKGDRCVLIIRKLEVEKGNLMATGPLESLTS